MDFSLLSPDFRGLVLLNYTESLEKKQKIQWRASSGDGAPKLQISVPCRGRTCPENRSDFLGVRFQIAALEDLNLLKLGSLNSSCPFFLSDNSIWGQ